MTALVKSSGNAPVKPSSVFGAVTAVREEFDDLAGGVVSGFPVLSIRGKVWRIRKGGEEVNYVDDEGEPVPYVDVVILKGSQHLAKIYYESKYSEGDTSPPRCWSPDSIKPDPAVTDPISKSCSICPKNVWGSKITEQGQKARACSDNRRLAIAFASELTSKGADATPMLLRIPPASLNPLKDYADKMLKPKGVKYYAVVTRIGFDQQVAYGKLTFRAIAFADDAQAQAILKLRDSDEVHRILVETTDVTEAAGAQEPAAPEPAPAAKKAPKPKLKPVETEEEEEGIDLSGPAEPAPAPAKKAPKPKLVATEEEDEEHEEQPAPKPAAKAAGKKDAGVQVDFDSLLDSILN